MRTNRCKGPGSHCGNRFKRQKRNRAASEEAVSKMQLKSASFTNSGTSGGGKEELNFGYLLIL